MRPKTLAVLAVVAVALGAFIWFVERDLPSSEERAERAELLLAVEPDDVAVVAIDWRGETVRLERQASEAPSAGDAGEDAGEGEDGPDEDLPPVAEWRLTEPLDARADQVAVETLLGALAGLRKVRTLEEPDRAAVGLERPRGSVTLTTADGERSLLVGADVPASENMIVGLAGEGGAWVTSRSILTQLEREPGEWRSREVVALVREDVERLRLRSAVAGEIVLARRDGRFYLEEPVEDLASADLVERLLADVSTLRAQRFLDRETAEDVGLDPPRAVIEAELEGGDTVRIELGAPVPGAGETAAPGAAGAVGTAGAVYAQVEGQRFEAATDLTAALERPAAAWRSPSWTELRSFEVDRIEAEEPGTGGTVELTREGVDWRRGEEEIPYTVASDLLFAVTEAEGEIGSGGPELGEPILTVRLASREGGRELLTLYQAADGEAGPSPARSSAREATLLLPQESISEILDALREVRAARPVAADDGEADE